MLTISQLSVKKFYKKNGAVLLLSTSDLMQSKELRKCRRINNRGKCLRL